MSQYPIILIPGEIERVKSAQPPVPAFTESLPQQPGVEPQKLNTTVIVVEATVATVPSVAIASQGGTVPGLLLFLAAAGAIAAQAWHQITTYPQRKQKHDREVVTYPKKVEIYEKKKRQHEEEVKATQSSERVAEFRYKLLLQVLNQTVPQDGNGSTALTGRREEQFGNCLRRYFPGKIQTQLKVQNPRYSEGYHYTPDFAYIDPDLNLYIDIEIDEPYKGNGEPIHFIELDTQRNRDDHFHRRGWIVIRFSEEQVARWPKSCCKTIATVITDISENESMLNKFTDVPNLQTVKRWTQAEAREMALSKFRDKY